MSRPEEPVVSSLSRWDRARWDRFGRVAVLLGGVAVLAAQWVRVGRTRVGDFYLHWEFGRRLVAGEWLHGTTGLDLPYLPFWAVAHAPLTVMTVQTAQVALVPLFVIALLTLLHVLNRVTELHWPLTPERAFWTAVLAVVLASRFLAREIVECGANLALVTLAWLGYYFWTQRKDVAGGSCLGLAVALKLTPALFVVWFAWKRQWRIVGVSLVVTAGLMLSPVLFMGWPSFAKIHGVWFHYAAQGMTNLDPSRGVLGEEPLQNMALRPAVARYLMTLPQGHIARVDHPWYVDFLNLPAETAGRITKVVMNLAAVLVFWGFRRRVVRRDEPALLWEAAAVSTMMLLYSPLTWGQHCVGLVPAFYLIVRAWASEGRLPRFTAAALGSFVLVVLVLNRAVVGKTGTYLLDSYRLPTFCMVGVLGAVLVGHARSRRANTVSVPLPTHANPLPRRVAA